MKKDSTVIDDFKNGYNIEINIKKLSNLKNFQKIKKKYSFFSPIFTVNH
jgi:hypothetical protein